MFCPYSRWFSMAYLQTNRLKISYNYINLYLTSTCSTQVEQNDKICHFPYKKCHGSTRLSIDESKQLNCGRRDLVRQYFFGYNVELTQIASSHGIFSKFWLMMELFFIFSGQHIAPLSWAKYYLLITNGLNYTKILK